MDLEAADILVIDSLFRYKRRKPLEKIVQVLKQMTSSC